MNNYVTTNTSLHFKDFLTTAFAEGAYSSEDAIGFLTEALRETIELHAEGMVLPTQRDECLVITDQRLDINEQVVILAKTNDTVVRNNHDFFARNAFQIVSQKSYDIETHVGSTQIQNKLIHSGAIQDIKDPCYVQGYYCYETVLGHHDALSDIFSLGLVLGSICFGLNLYNVQDLERFVTLREQAYYFNHKIHATLAGLIHQMTELDRSKRLQDLNEVLERLINYRDYNIENTTDLTSLAGWKNQDKSNQQLYILGKLRNRLFDTSRRNRMLYYKSNSRFVNLTIGSVPNVLHYKNIRPDYLFTWHEELAKKLLKGKDIILNTYVRLDDHKYLASALDKIRIEAQRSKQELGFSPLKLVAAMLNWHNFKESAEERIQTPLLLLPVELKRVKKLNEDFYVLNVLSHEAEVNPILANQLRDLYNIQLPDFVDLEQMPMDAFYAAVKQQIEQSKQGIQLSYGNQPRIKLMHTIARQTIQNFKRKQRPNGAHYTSYKDIDYSYQKDYFKPLGLEIFKNRIKANASTLELLVDGQVKLEPNHLSGPTKKRDLYELVESNSNPYQWEFDICNIVIGNFNYRKMSLVRDYNQIIDTKLEHKVFNELFHTEAPKPVAFPSTQNVNDWYHVIQADTTQTQAVQFGRSGANYIIQGPPGTGKSQTITNLIADFMAQGKTVLFVCEKRAALDVVYHRLKQVGLDSLCCYIHDSQEDKKDFVMDVKRRYEHLTKTYKVNPLFAQQREQKLQQLQEALQLLQHYHHTNQEAPNQAGISIRNLVERALQLNTIFHTIPAEERVYLPMYSAWLQSKETIESLCKAVEESIGESNFAAHPAALLNETLFENAQAVQTIQHLSDSLLEQEKKLHPVITSFKEFDPQCSLQQLETWLADAQELQLFHQYQSIDLLLEDSNLSATYREALQTLHEAKQAYQESQKETTHWITKFNLSEAEQALQIAEKHETSFLKFMSGEWRQIKHAVEENYNFAQHQIKPSISSVLQHLIHELKTEKAVQQSEQELAQRFPILKSLSHREKIQALQLEVKQQKRFQFLLQHSSILESIYQYQVDLKRLLQDSHQLLANASSYSLVSLFDTIQTIRYNQDSLIELSPILNAYSQLPIPLKQYLRKTTLQPQQMEAGMVYASLQDILKNNARYAGTDFVHLNKTISQINQLLKSLLQLNATCILEQNANQFLSQFQLSSCSESQLNLEQKQQKRLIQEGKKILENEFGKSMRYKSIRELVEKESGHALKLIKPVWLMSPLSVSDSLPLQTALFDVVIFDEASQITLEEGVPALYRSQQVIIVGDDKQMPPTNFFSSKTEDPDDMLSRSEEEEYMLSDDTDSILVQGVRKLNSTMLRWHYRSHYETLISYSNHAFYEANLFTIPDKVQHNTPKPMAPIETANEALQNSAALFDRSMSYHYYPKAVYENRSNLEEANYIANLVRSLLMQETKESIGIVAFSMEQQQTIENALTQLASTDPAFEKQLEEAYDRYEEEQFVGLIIKNLENIQGDERDIIILSICYGPDSKGRMLMNFGPINKKGGEKRLNVIFSRAKKHVAVISTIKHHQITNEYNEGANYLKRYLHYAEAISNGTMDLARTVLQSLVMKEDQTQQEQANGIVTDQLSAVLRSKGYEVVNQVGQSDFKIAMAVKANKEDEQFTVAILTDDAAFYAQENIVELFAQRKQILQQMGWRVVQVFAKDWLQHPEHIISLIEKRLREDEIEEELPLPEPTIDLPITPFQPEPDKSQPVPANGLPFETYTHTQDGHHKFWEVALEEEKLLVRFGKIGTKGQTQVKSFATADLALKEKEKLVREKLSKGYMLTN